MNSSDHPITKNVDPHPGEYLLVRPYYSGFDFAHDTYNALLAVSDGTNVTLKPKPLV